MSHALPGDGCELIDGLPTNECPRRSGKLEINEFGNDSARQQYVVRSEAGERYIITSEVGTIILGLIDGTQSVADMQRLLAEDYGCKIPRDKIIEFLDICASNDLLAADSWGVERSINVPRSLKREKLGLYSQVYNADEILDFIIEYKRFWLNPVTKGLAALLFLAGLVSLFFIPAGGGLIAPIRQLDLTFTDVFLLLLPLVFVIELISHELGHALACRLMGARPKGFGCGLLWGIIPIVFTDTTDAYTIQSKYKRMFVSFAGPMVDIMFFGLVMMLYYAYSDHPLAAKLLLAYSAFPLTSFVLSLNPFFIRMDGYWILADWLDKPNLRRSSMRYLKRRLGKNARSSGQDRLEGASDRRLYVTYILIASAWTFGYLFYVFFESVVTLSSLIDKFFSSSIYL